MHLIPSLAQIIGSELIVEFEINMQLFIPSLLLQITIHRVKLVCLQFTGQMQVLEICSTSLYINCVTVFNFCCYILTC